MTEGSKRQMVLGVSTGPQNCQYETGLTVEIRQHPLNQSLFATLKEAEKNLPGVVIPEILREQTRSEMVETLRLNLIKLPEGSVDEEALTEIAKPLPTKFYGNILPFTGRCCGTDPYNWECWFGC